MDFNQMVPIIVFDDKCYLCSKFAKFVYFLSRGKFTIIGHYSQQGMKIREQILDDSALEMFWLIDEQAAYGGRAALFPLLLQIFKSKKDKPLQNTEDKECHQGCKTVKSVFVRSASLLSKSKKIKLK